MYNYWIFGQIQTPILPFFCRTSHLEHFPIQPMPRKRPWPPGAYDPIPVSSMDNLELTDTQNDLYIKLVNFMGVYTCLEDIYRFMVGNFNFQLRCLSGLISCLDQRKLCGGEWPMLKSCIQGNPSSSYHYKLLTAKPPANARLRLPCRADCSLNL